MNFRRHFSWTGCLLALTLSGCGDDTETTTNATTDEAMTTSGSTDAGGSTGAPTTTSQTTGVAGPSFADVQAIFTAACSCHLTTAGPGNGDLELSDGKAYANLVGVPSSMATMVNRVEPGDPSASYLYLKLAGGFADVPGGGGDPMPLIGGPLSADDLATIEAWITAGAPKS